jgi:hypothetical protein
MDKNILLKEQIDELTNINLELKTRVEELEIEFLEKEKYYQSTQSRIDELEKNNKLLKKNQSDLDIENSDLIAKIERMEINNKISDSLRYNLIKSKEHYDKLIENSKLEVDKKIQELEYESEVRDNELRKK